MRQAFLIIAHNEFGVLRELVSALDDAGNDIYIHIDRKVRDIPVVKTEHSHLSMTGERLDVRWGTVSQIRVELLLLETARRNGPYDFYHIISGTHLPLAGLQELNSFYGSHLGQEVMRFWPEDEGDADFKLRRFHFFKGCGLLWKASLKIQKLLGIRHLTKESFVKTDNWISIGEKACSFLCSEKRRILRKYRWSHCGDEYFAASELKAREGFDLFNYDKLLYVRFRGANPETFPLTAREGLKSTGCLWARKFRTEQDDTQGNDTRLADPA